MSAWQVDLLSASGADVDVQWTQQKQIGTRQNKHVVQDWFPQPSNKNGESISLVFSSLIQQPSRRRSVPLTMSPSSFVTSRPNAWQGWPLSGRECCVWGWKWKNIPPISPPYPPISWRLKMEKYPPHIPPISPHIPPCVWGWKLKNIPPISPRITTFYQKSVYRAAIVYCFAAQRVPFLLLIVDCDIAKWIDLRPDGRFCHTKCIDWYAILIRWLWEANLGLGEPYGFGVFVCIHWTFTPRLGAATT